MRDGGTAPVPTSNSFKLVLYVVFNFFPQSYCIVKVDSVSTRSAFIIILMINLEWNVDFA